MSDTQSLGSQLKDDLLNNLSVSITAVVLAVLALAGVTTSDQVDGGLFLAVNLAVFLPWAYDTYWPVEYNPIPAVVWTVSAALVTTGLYLGSYVLFERLVSPEFVKEPHSSSLSYSNTAYHASTPAFETRHNHP